MKILKRFFWYVKRYGVAALAFGMVVYYWKDIWAYLNKTATNLRNNQTN